MSVRWVTADVFDGLATLDTGSVGGVGPLLWGDTKEVQ